MDIALSIISITLLVITLVTVIYWLKSPKLTPKTFGILIRVLCMIALVQIVVFISFIWNISENTIINLIYLAIIVCASIAEAIMMCACIAIKICEFEKDKEQN